MSHRCRGLVSRRHRHLIERFKVANRAKIQTGDHWWSHQSLIHVLGDRTFLHGVDIVIPGVLYFSVDSGGPLVHTIY